MGSVHICLDGLNPVALDALPMHDALILGQPDKRQVTITAISDPAKPMLFFKLVFLDFSVKCPLRNTQIPCRIFAFVVVFVQRPKDQFLFFLFNR